MSKTKKEIIIHQVNYLMETIDKALEIKLGINTLISEFIKENRKFADGERVSIYKMLSAEKIGEGIVASCATSLFLDNFQSIYLAEYKKKNKIFEALQRLRYEIMAIKNNGQVSSKHFFQIPHFITDIPNSHGEYYIKKI